MGSGGGIILGEKLGELKGALENYYSSISELKLGLKTELPPKPEALVLLEQCEQLGMTLTGSTGLIDQPHIWMQEIAMVLHVRQTFQMLEDNNASQN